MLAVQAQSNQRWQTNLRSSGSRASTPSSASSALSHRSSLSSASSHTSTPSSSTRRNSDVSSHPLSASKSSTSVSSLHHRRVSSFSASDISPLTADTKQVGRTPRRRPTETDHRISTHPLPAVALPSQTVEVKGAVKVEDGDDVDQMIVRKLQHLLEEALHIQQVQAQQGHSPPLLTPIAAPIRPMDERGRPSTAPPARSEVAAAKPINRRLTLTPASAPHPSRYAPTPAPASSAPPTPVRPPPLQPLIPVNAAAEVSLSAMITGFLLRVLELLRLLEERLMKRLSQFQSAAVEKVKEVVGVSGGLSLYEKWKGKSTSMLSSFHQAMHTPIITLHYPAVLTPLIPSYLTSRASPAPTSIPLNSSLPISPISSPPSTSSPPSPDDSSPSASAECEVLRSTIAQLHVLLQHQSTSLSSQSRLRAENDELRELIEAQEQQITRQQAVIAEVRRELERQVGMTGESEMTVEGITMSRLMGEEWQSDTSLIQSW